MRNRARQRCGTRGFDYRTRDVDSTLRILHLVAQDADFQTRRSIEALRDRMGGGFRSFVQWMEPAGYRDLTKTTWHLRQLEREDVDVIHLWGERPLTAAAMGARVPVLYSPASSTSHRHIAWARAVMSYRPLEVVCSSSTQRRMHVERGVAHERCHLIRPGADFSRIRSRRDVQLRARFGFGDDDRVLLACGESIHTANHREAIWAGAILHLLDPRYRVLLWGRGPLVKSVRHLADASNLRGAFVFASDSLNVDDYEALLPASDAIVINARGAVATLPIAISMASGLPIVSTVTYTTSELLEDRHSALMVAPERPRLFARRVMDLYEDPRLQWSISETARAEAYEYHSLTRFLNDYRALYRRIAGVEAPASESPVVGRSLQAQA